MKKYLLAFSMLCGAFLHAADRSYTANATVAEDLELTGNYTVYVSAGITVRYTGKIMGTGPLVLSGGGTLILANGANTYTHGTIIDAGALRAECTGALSTGTVTIKGQRADWTGFCELQIGCAETSAGATVNNAISITGTSTATYPALYFLGTNSIVNGAVTAASDLVFYEDHNAARAVFSNNYNRFTRVHSATFNAPITVAGSLGYRGMTRWQFNARVTAQQFNTNLSRPTRTGDHDSTAGNNNAHGCFTFAASSNRFELVHTARTPIYLGAVDALALARVEWERDMAYCTYATIYNYAYDTSACYDQHFASLSSDSPRGTDTTEWAVRGDSWRTVTLTGEGTGGARERTAVVALKNRMNLVVDAPEFTQILSNGVHTISGTITVKRGTLRFIGATAFTALSGIAVESAGILDCAYTATNDFPVLSSLALTGTLFLPEGKTISTKKLIVNGQQQKPGFYGPAHFTQLKRGYVLCRNADGSMPDLGALASGETARYPFSVTGDHTWKVNAGETITLDNALVYVGGTVQVESPRASTDAKRGTVRFQGTNILDGAFIATSAVVSVSGLLATPAHADQGQPAHGGARTFTVNGSAGLGYLAVSNAVIEKPVYLCHSGYGALQAAAHTTNRFTGAVYCSTPWLGFTGAAGSDVAFEGGLELGWSLRSTGGTIRLRHKPVVAVNGVGWNVGDQNTLVLETPGNRFIYLSTGHYAADTSMVVCACSQAFDCTAGTALMNGYYWNDSYQGLLPLSTGWGTLELGNTQQRVNLLCGSARSTVRGENGARLEILRQEAVGYVKARELYFASQLEGDVTLAMYGTGTLLLTNRTFETAGALIVTNGAVVLAPDAAWRGTGSITVRGAGKLVLSRADQLPANCDLYLGEKGTLALPAGETLNVNSIQIWDGTGWIRSTTGADYVTGGGALLATAEDTSQALEMPLEWNTTYPTARPYEVVIDTTKLAALNITRADTRFDVFALTAAGRRALGVTHFTGRHEQEVAVRFTPPAGTTGLVCRVGVGLRVDADETEVDNLFAGALQGACTWTLEGALTRTVQDHGTLLANPVCNNHYATVKMPLPESWRGCGAVLEIDCQNLSQLAWGGYIRVWQYDAQGKRLAESVVDPRWTSHIRPPGKLTCYREEGRFHPEAATIAVRFEVRGVATAYDNAGLPLSDSTAGLARLLVSRLVLRRAERLPFPRYADTFFDAGVSDVAGDRALILGGENHTAFFFATHSQAAWAEAQAFTNNTLTFFPDADGTVEAWFKPTAWPAKETYLFLGYQGYSAQKSASGRGMLMALKYLESAKRLTLYLKDRTNAVYTAAATCALPTHAWTHLAAQWSTNGTAAVYVNGAVALSLNCTGYAPLVRSAEKYPNEEGVTEFFLGCHHYGARDSDSGTNASYPYFEGAVDELRISSVCRYAGEFEPPRQMTVTDDVRAHFSFDRTFDGTSGGGARFIRGSVRSAVPRVAHTLTCAATPYAYYPETILPANDTFQVLNLDNFTNLPTVADFQRARSATNRIFDVTDGARISFTLPARVYPDYVEIANTGDTPLVYPAVVGAGEVDPRSFADIRRTLGMDALDDRAAANTIFQYMISASDYFMNHTAYITPATDTPDDVEYQALTMLNGYCGFECGPLNSMTKNVFACSGHLPASQTGGYGHSFEQVFYDRKNHIYDLSAQSFFAAMDNETAAYLQEAGDEPGLFHRLGKNPDHFIRKATRGPDASDPAFREKVAMTLNPGERLRMWFDNAGEVNDLQCALATVERADELYKENYDAHCHTTPGKSGSIYRVHRFFPQYGNAYLVYEGAYAANNPAFARSTATALVYAVNSCYPIVAGRYAAYLASGATVPLEISTDDGVTYRALDAGLVRYPVRARTSYLIRAAVAPAQIAFFSAMTVLQENARILTGRIRGGANDFTFTCTAGDRARVTFAGRTDVKKITIAGGVYSGTIAGSERQLIVLQPNETQTFNVTGTSAQARTRTWGGVAAVLKDGGLTISAGTCNKGFGAVDIVDGTAIKQLTVLVAPQARLLTAGREITPTGTATLLAADDERIQPCINFVTSASGAQAAFNSVPPGKYVLLTLDRYESHMPSVGSCGIRVRIPNTTDGAVPCSHGADGTCMYLKAHYGRKGVDARANFKWNHPCTAQGNSYYSAQMRVFTITNDTDRLTFSPSWTSTNGVELAAALLVAADRAGEDEELYCDLIKVLCGLNCQPWRVNSGCRQDEETFVVRPTFCSCGVEWATGFGVTDPALEYRLAAGGIWQRAARFPRFPETGSWRGSICDLAEDTAYDVRIVDREGHVWRTATFRTWRSDVPVARTIVLNPATNVFPLVVSERGTSNGWLRITLPPGTVLTNHSTSAATFQVKNAAYVLFDDMELVGGARTVFELTASAGVRIRNCRISGWGRTGVARYDLPEGGKYYLSSTSTRAINNDGAISIGAGMSETVVERCWIHDPRGRANSWYYSHPAGPEAIMMYSPEHSTVLRWNDFASSDQHRFNDAVEGSGNFYRTGGFRRDADIYGNYMAFCQDDCIELDGGMNNVRCFDNRFESALCGVSVQGCMVSPTYVFRNNFTGMGDEMELKGQSIKTSTYSDGTGTGTDVWTYVWHNLFLYPGSGVAFPAKGVPWNLSVTGNVFATGVTISETARATAASEWEPNEMNVSLRLAQAPSDRPVRPMPFTLDRARLEGITVKDGKLQPIEAAGQIDVGPAVIRWRGTPATTSYWPVISSASVFASTNTAVFLDVQNDLTLARDFTTGPLSFVKTGPGTLFLLGASENATFKFLTGQPSSAFRHTTVSCSDYFAYPDDGTLPTTGFGVFSILEGALVQERGTSTIRATAWNGRATIGGWTARLGECEKDVALIIRGGTFILNPTTYVGDRHGFANYNTPNGPAHADVIVQGGTLNAKGLFALGAYSSAPSGYTYNSAVSLRVSTGGVMASSEFRFIQAKGQTANCTVDGGLFDGQLVKTGIASTRDPCTNLFITVCQGGIYRAATFTVNSENHASPAPVALDVSEGGMFLVDDFKVVGTGTITLSVNGGTLGCREDAGAAVRYILPSNGTACVVGPQGLAIRARGQQADGAPVTCIVGSPLTGEGPVTIDATAGNKVIFAGGNASTGATRILGGVLALPSGTFTVTAEDLARADGVELGGTLIVNTAHDVTVMCPITGTGTLVKTGSGTLTLAGKLTANVLEAREGQIVVSQPGTGVGCVRFVRGSVVLGANAALENAALEWVEPTAACENCAYLDLNGCLTTNGCLRSVMPSTADGHFWIRNRGKVVNWYALNAAPGTNCVVLGIDANIRLLARRPTNFAGGLQVFSNLVIRATGAAFTGGSKLLLTGEAHFPNLTELVFHSGGQTEFALTNTQADAFPALLRVTIDSHTLTLNPVTLACFRNIRRQWSWKSNKNSALVLPENGVLVMATWIERSVSPNFNHAQGVYNPAAYVIAEGTRSLSPASARLRVLSSGPGEVLLPAKGLKVIIR